LHMPQRSRTDLGNVVLCFGLILYFYAADLPQIHLRCPSCSSFLSELATQLLVTSRADVLAFNSCAIFEKYAEALNSRDMIQAVGPLNGDWHHAAHLLGSLVVDRDGQENVDHHVWYVQAMQQSSGTDFNWGLCWPSLQHGMIWRSLHHTNLSFWSPLAARWCNFSQMIRQDFSITILGQCWHGVGHGLFHATIFNNLRGVHFPCEIPMLHSINESTVTSDLQVAYDECAKHSPTRFAELWCANGVGHDASHYIAFDSHNYCINVASFATSASCFRYFFYSSSAAFSWNSMLECHTHLLVGGAQASGCIFAVASVSRESTSLPLSKCFDAVSQTKLVEVPNALVSCAAGLQIDCSQLTADRGISCRPMAWDVLVTSYTTLISTLAVREEQLDPLPWPLLAG